jgi:hypothetical protein
MTVFVAFYEIILKINHMLLVGSYFCPQEDLGTMCILSAFTEDTDKIAHTALEDAPVSEHQSYHLHSPFRALHHKQEKSGGGYARSWFGHLFFRAGGLKQPAYTT